MSWFKVDDGLHTHPKALAAGDAALGAWVRLGSWCSNHLTDGLVPKQVAELMTKPAQRRALLDAGLLVETVGGYELHDYLAYNPSRERVEADRRAGAERVAKSRANRGVSSGARRGGVSA